MAYLDLGDGAQSECRGEKNKNIHLNSFIIVVIITKSPNGRGCFFNPFNASGLMKNSIVLTGHLRQESLFAHGLADDI